MHLSDLANALDQRIHHVADLLGYDCEYYSIDGNEVELFSMLYHSCGCCPPEIQTESFPIEYLSMYDEEIKEKKEAA